MNSIRNRFLIGMTVAAMISSAALVIVVINRYHLFAAELLMTNFAFSEVYQHVLLPLFVFILMFSVGTFLVVRHVERVLNETAADVRKAARSLEAYSGPVERLPAELRPLIEAFNELTQKLEAHSKRQQAFAADAAHELKTPLAVLALELDKFPKSETRRLQDQVKGLSTMIDQLLLLARSNSKHTGTSGPLIHPDSIGKSIVEQLAPSAMKCGVSLAFESERPALFHGLEEAVSAAVRTLVVNAIRATPEGGLVTVRTGPGARFTVTDGGGGLDEGSLVAFKARGVSGDMAERGEAGLGLSIADRIVEAHGGELLTCMPAHVGLELVFPDSRPA